jgi:hypothetical protein
MKADRNFWEKGHFGCDYRAGCAILYIYFLTVDQFASICILRLTKSAPEVIFEYEFETSQSFDSSTSIYFKAGVVV